MSRTKIVQSPLSHQPKKCLVTGRADGDVVDFGVSAKVGPLPRVYVKLSEVEKAAKLAGMLDAREVAALQEERSGLIAENARLSSELRTSTLHARADAAQMAYAGASAAAAVILQHNPSIELPDAAIIAAAEELVEPTKDQIINPEA